MQSIGVGNSSGKVRLLQPVGSLAREHLDDSQPSGWRAHRSEILVIAAIWGLALAQVAIVVGRGGAWALDSSLALVFALVCPLALRGFRSAKGGAE